MDFGASLQVAFAAEGFFLDLRVRIVTDMLKLKHRPAQNTMAMISNEIRVRRGFNVFKVLDLCRGIHKSSMACNRLGSKIRSSDEGRDSFPELGPRTLQTDHLKRRRHMNRILLLTLMAGALSACIQVRDPEAKKEEAPKVTAAVSAINAKVTPLPRPQTYWVQFEGVREGAQIQRLSVNDKGQKLVEPLSKPEDVVKNPGLVEYSILEAGKPERRIRVEIPKDHVISGFQKVSSLQLEDLGPNPWGLEKRFRVTGRLYFQGSSALITEGHKLLIEATTIESEGATLQTFSDDQLLAMNTDGRHGGLIYLRSRELKGTLQVNMYGQSSELQNFLSQDQRNQGYNGGSSGQLIVEIENLSFGRIRHEALPGKGGEGKPVYAFCWGGCQNPILKPAGPKGQDGVAQGACWLRNGRCEELRD